MDYHFSVTKKQDIRLHSIPRMITEENMLVTESLCYV